jgi:hydroxyacylglutathione hydrolase
LKIQRFLTGPLEVNCYLMIDEATGKAAVLDPGGMNPQLEAAINQIGEKNVEKILLTHGHFDHIGGVSVLQKKTGAQVFLYEEDKDFPGNSSLNLSVMAIGQEIPSFSVDRLLKDGETFSLGKTAFTVLHTPGHTQGSCCYLSENVLFTGDTLMRNSVGRTDFPTGNMPKLTKSLQQLALLPGNYTIYPGHGEPSTLDEERKRNPYLGMML